MEHRACDQRLARLICCIHYIVDSGHYGHVGDQVSARFLVNVKFFGDRTHVRAVVTDVQCNKQTVTSFSSTERDKISLDGGPRMEWLPALVLTTPSITIL